MPSKRSLITTGFLEQVGQFIDDNEDEIKAAGLNPAVLKGRVEPAKNAVVQAEAAADNADRAATIAHQAAEAAGDAGYDTGSNLVDTLSGGLDKKSELGKQILALRADANRRRRTKTPDAAPGATSPA